MPNSLHRVLSNRVLRVEAGAPLRRSRTTARKTASHAAVFAGGDFLGISSLDSDVLSSHDMTYGDLVGRQQCVDVLESTSVEELGRLFEDDAIEALIVRNDAGQFVGTVTRQSLLDGLLTVRSPADDSPAIESGIALTQSGRVLSRERQFLECLLTADSPDGGLTELIETIESLSDGMICSILLMNDDGTQLRSGAAISLPDEYVRATDGIPIGPGAGSCGTAAFLNEKVIVSDIATDPLWVRPRQLALKHGLRACWSVPIRSAEGKVLGTFAMYYTEPRSPDAYHEHLIGRAVHLAAIAIERRQAEASLLRSEQRLRRAQQIAHVGSFELAADGTPTCWSDECFRIFGVDPKGQLPTRAQYIENVIHPDDREMSRQVVEQALRECTAFNYEYRIRRPDGTVRWVHTVGQPICDGSNQIVSVEGTILDITEWKLAELKIRESERKFRTMFESVPECVKLLDADGNLLDMNAPGLRLIEADTIDQIRGLSAFDLVVPEYQQEFRDNLQAVFAGESNSQEFEIISLDGKRRWMQTHQVPLRNEQGDVSSLLAVTRDITERKRSDDVLQALAEGTASATGTDFFASFSRALARVFKTRYVVVCEHLDSPATRSRTLAFWMHDRLGENIEYDLAGGPCEETANGKTTFYPAGIQGLFPEDTDLVEMQAESYCGFPLADSSGRVIGHLAMLDDQPMERNLCELPALPVFAARAAAEIERLQVERSLRESKQRLNAVISDLPVIITTVNENGDVTLFDGRGLESLDFWPGQFVGRNYFDLWRERPELTTSMRKCLRGGVPAPTTIDVGDRRIETRYSPLHNSTNEVTGAITVCIDVTERVRTENELRENHNLLNSILDGTSDPVFVKDEQGRYLMVNSACARVFGRTAEAIIGRNDFEILPEDVATAVMEVDTAVRTSGRTITLEEVVPSDSEGMLRTYISTKAPYYNHEGEIAGIIGIAHDITERKLAEEALRNSEARSRSMLEGSPVCTKIIDLELRLQYMSRAGQEMLKIADVQPFYGNPFPCKLYPEPYRPLIRERLERAKRGEITNMECSVIDTEGNEVWLDTTFVPARNDDGRIEHIIVTSVNITERRQAEEDARRHRNDLAHVSRVSTMGEMATGIAHELNQPLAAIAAYGETAKLIVEREYPEADDLPDMLGNLKDQALRAGKIVERLRSYIKKSEPVRTTVDLHQLVQNVARFVDPDIRQAGVALQLNLEEPSQNLLVDEIQLQQVLVNLVRNAVDAMRETPYENRRLTITSRNCDGGRVEVVVCDAGEGLSQEDLSEVFEAFYTTKQEGMGMGLPISRSIVESHGGKLWAKRNESVGMTFGFSIPRSADD